MCAFGFAVHHVRRKQTCRDAARTHWKHVLVLVLTLLRASTMCMVDWWEFLHGWMHLWIVLFDWIAGCWSPIQMIAPVAGRCRCGCCRNRSLLLRLRNRNPFFLCDLAWKTTVSWWVTTRKIRVSLFSLRITCHRKWGSAFLMGQELGDVFPSKEVQW